MNNLTLLNEKNFTSTMNKKVIPFLKKRKTVHFVQSMQGGLIHAETLVPDEEFHSVLVMFHGFCEFCAKYDEITYYALQHGFAVCRFDHRGHGFSPRDNAVKDNPSKVHIEKFETYIVDAHKVVSQVAKPLAKKKPLFLFAHSMGGAVGALYLAWHTQDFKAAILNSPMLQINLMGLPLWMAEPIANAMRIKKGNTAYAPSQREFPFNLVLNTQKQSATSVNRHSYFYEKRFEDKRLQTWGGTMLWICQCIKAIRLCKKKSLVKNIKTPILLFQAENDTTVMPQGQNDFVNNVPSASLHVLKGANHEVFIGKNEFALPWYRQMFLFYKKHL